MESRPLGKTGLQVSPLGFGTFKIGRNQKIKYPQPYDLPDEATVERLLNGILDLGITHIDAAPAYGLAEERVGNCLSQRRKEFVLSTKVGERFENGESRYEFGRAAVEQSVEHSLSKLQTDVLDVVLIHTPADDVRVLTETPVVETLQQLKAAGKIRAIGLSGKTVEAARMALDWADVLMVEYHIDDTSHADVIAEAARRGVGIMVKKALASGHLPPSQALPFAANTPGVGSIVVGGLSLEHMAENVRIIAGN
jgi:aryl-alcohol dehydrogenase-like predicted oxidoreductase